MFGSFCRSCIDRQDTVRLLVCSHLRLMNWCSQCKFAMKDQVTEVEFVLVMELWVLW